MTASETNEFVRLVNEAVQRGKNVSILLAGDPNWFRALTIEQYGDPAGALFTARVMNSSGGYARLIARNDNIIAVQII